MVYIDRIKVLLRGFENGRPMTDKVKENSIRLVRANIQQIENLLRELTR
jgi:hypothetical protein